MTFANVPTNVTTVSSYSEDGITVTSADNEFWSWPSAGQLHMDPGFQDDYTFTFGGNPFNAVSIDISDTSSGTLTFTAFDSSNTLVGTQAFAAPTGTLNLSAFTGIYSLRMVNTVAHLSVDNFVLSAVAVGAVPEPAAWAMMIGGFGLIGGVMRRRKVRIAYA